MSSSGSRSQPRCRRDSIWLKLKSCFAETSFCMSVVPKGFSGYPVCCLFSLVISRKAFLTCGVLVNPLGTN